MSPATNAEPAYQDELATLYNADCLKVLQHLPSHSVDAVITDPPYSSGGATQTARKRPAKSKYESSGIVNQNPDFQGDGRDQRSYEYWCALWMAECLRITKPGGLFMTFTDWRQYPVTADALQAGGWIWRGTITWLKPNGTVRPCLGRFTNPCEFVLWGSNGEMTEHATKQISPRGWIESRAPKGDKRVHITEKPVDLMRYLMQLSPDGGTVLDPFMGSGTTGVAAKSAGMHFIGIEVTKHYFETACRRLSQDALALGGAA